MTEQKTTPSVRPHRPGLRHVNTRAQSPIRDAFAAQGFDDPQIVLRWRDFAGAALGRLTAPLSLSPQGLLTISADPAAALFVQHQTAQLVQKLNLALGRPRVAKIKVVSGKFDPGPPSAALRPALTGADRAQIRQIADTVSDPNLRAALEKLGTGVALEAKAPRNPAVPATPRPDRSRTR